MSDLSYLDTISNKELHQKCLQYGLPNIPVTDTTRKLIMKRLREAMLGSPTGNRKSAAAATKKTPRRETVHGSKVTPAAAPAAKAKVAANEGGSRNNNNNNSRRTVAASYGNNYPLEESSRRIVETTTTVSDVGSQSEDDDYRPNATYPNRDDRPRRSVSLTKSGVLTTSYTREVNEPIYVEDDDEDIPQSHTYQRPNVARTLPSYVPHVERTRNSGLPTQGLTQTLLNSTSYAHDTPDYTEQSSAMHRNTYGGSAAPFNLRSPSTSISPTAVRERTSGIQKGRLIQPLFKANTLYPQLDSFYDQANSSPPVEHMEVDTDSESEGEQRQQQRSFGNSNVESPYLSNYSRQLDARKRSSPLAKPQKRPTIGHEIAESPIEQFKVFMRSLDRQYHIKFYFFLLLAVIIATFIYVLVTPV